MTWTSAEEGPPRAASVKAGRRRWWPLRRTLPIGIAAAVAVLCIATVVVVVVRYVPAVQALQQGRNDVLGAETVLRQGGLTATSDQVTQATELLISAGQDFGSRSSVVDSGWLMGLAQHLPWLGGNVTAVRSMRHAGSSGVSLALDLIPILRVLHGTGAPTGGPGVVKELASLADTQRAAIAGAQADLTAFDSAVNAIPAAGLIGPVDHFRVVAQQAQQRLDGPMRGGLAVVQALPRAVGAGRHRYLLLLANPGEERGGGGFIGAAGTVVFQDGQLVSSAFMSSSFSDALVRNIPAPAPIAAITNTNLVLSDSNWSPDFPTSAALAAEFYTRATGQAVDGVINVDPVALSYVLKVIGSVRVAPYAQVVSATNALRELNYIINSARPGDPGKAYLAPFGHAVVDAAFKTSRTRWVPLANALEQGAREKHIVLHFKDPQLQKLVSTASTGGVLPQRPSGDAVLVADSNLSGTKGDLFVTRHFDLNVSLDAKGHAVDRLTLTYHNPQVTAPADAALLTNSAGLYEDYVRVYLPQAANFDDLSVSDAGAPIQSVSPEDTGVENHRQWIAYRVLLDVNQTTTVTFVYDGPFGQVQPGGSVSYELNWEKQIDALSWPASVEVRRADGARFHWATGLRSDLQMIAHAG